MIAIYIVLIAFQVWAIVDCLRLRSRSMWVLAVLLFGPFGALAYVASELFRGRWFGEPLATVPTVRDPRIQEIETLLASNPAPALFIELAELHARRGDHRAAADAYGRALKTDPDSLYARYHLGRALAAQGRHVEAVQEFEQVHAQDSRYDYGAAAEALADALLAAGRDAEALTRYADLAEVSARARPTFQMGMLLDRAGRRAEALEVMREIVDQEEAIPAYLRAREMPWVEQARHFLEGASSDASSAVPTGKSIEEA